MTHSCPTRRSSDLPAILSSCAVEMMVRSESGVNAAVYLGSFDVATITGQALVDDARQQAADAGEDSPAVPRTIALVGLMGAGQSGIGRLLRSEGGRGGKGWVRTVRVRGGA